MKKKIFSLIVLTASILTLTACGKKEETKKELKDNKAAIAFKKDYESINGQKSKTDKQYRTVTIPKDNVFEQITAKEALEKIEKGETFYIYFGDKLCPWCRSVIETANKIAKKNKVTKIYYVAIWDKDGNEILRDKYEIDKKDKVKKVSDGTEEYSKLLEKLDNVLSDYTLTNSKKKKVKVGEKRIYAPNFIYVKKGQAVKLTEGISEKQVDAYAELTEEILKDEENLFNEFFKN